MLIAKTTELAEFDAFRVEALVLGRVVIATFAFAAGQYNSISGHCLPLEVRRFVTR